MKSCLTVFMLFASALLAVGQVPDLSDQGRKPGGKIKTIVHSRSYIIWKKQHVEPVSKKLVVREFDRTGREVQSSVFGANGERRMLYDDSGPESKTRILYFDLAGNPIADKAFEFVPPFMTFHRTDLCREFSTTTEKDVQGKVEFDTERCTDGSIRSTTITERGAKDYVYREYFKDAKNRTLEFRYEYDLNGDEKKVTYKVNNMIVPEYWVEIVYADYKFDAKNNWVRTIATSVNSSSPREPVYQFIEEQSITYYE